MTPAPARPSIPLPRPSATLVLVRDGAPGPFEVLLLQRADRGDQNSAEPALLSLHQVC